MRRFLPVLCLCLLVLAIPGQPTQARFSPLPDFFDVSDVSNTSSWGASMSATCDTVTVSISYPQEENPFGIPDVYDSVDWSLTAVIGTDGTIPVQGGLIGNFPVGTPGGTTQTATFALDNTQEAGTLLHVEVTYTINGGSLGGGSDTFDIGDLDHPYWMARTRDTDIASNANTFFCDDAEANTAPTVNVVGDVVAFEGNSFPIVLYLDQPHTKPVTVDLEGNDNINFPGSYGTFPGFNGYSSRGITYGTNVCLDGGPVCVTPDYTQVTFAPGETVKTINATLPGRANEPDQYFYEPSSFNIHRAANANLGSYRNIDVIRKDNDGCLAGSPPDECETNFYVPDGCCEGGLDATIVPGDEVTYAVANQIVDEDAGMVTFTVNLSQPNPDASAVQVTYATNDATALAGQDYVATSGTLSFAQGEQTKTITVNLINDSVVEPNEHFGLALEQVGGSWNRQGTAGALIQDGDIAAPSDLTVTGSDADQIDLLWADNSDDETGFRVERSANGSTDWTTDGNVGAGVTDYTDGGLTCDTTLYYRVIALRGGDVSLPSNVVSGITTACASNTPEPTATNSPGELGELLTGADFEGDMSMWTVNSKGTVGGDKVRCNKTDRPNGKPDKIFSYSGDCAFRFKGGVGEKTRLRQIIVTDGMTFAAGDVLSFNVYVDAGNDATNGKIKVRVNYSDDTPTSKLTYDLTSTDGNYQSIVGSVSINSAAVKKVKVIFVNRSTAGNLYIDDVSLVHTTGIPLPAPIATSPSFTD